jgi:hypothetical protein
MTAGLTFWSPTAVYPQMDLVRRRSYRQPILLFRSHRDRTFEDVTALAGLEKLPPSSRRGAAFGDVNNDGKVDVLILNVGEAPTLLINRTPGAGHSVLFKLEGNKSNKAAIGARVKIKAGDLVQFAEVRGGSSYLSQSELVLTFGWGQETQSGRSRGRVAQRQKNSLTWLVSFTHC